MAASPRSAELRVVSQQARRLRWQTSRRLAAWPEQSAAGFLLMRPRRRRRRRRQAAEKEIKSRSKLFASAIANDLNGCCFEFADAPATADHRAGRFIEPAGREWQSPALIPSAARSHFSEAGRDILANAAYLLCCLLSVVAGPTENSRRAPLATTRRRPAGKFKFLNCRTNLSW